MSEANCMDARMGMDIRKGESLLRRILVCVLHNAESNGCAQNFRTGYKNYQPGTYGSRGIRLFN